MANPNFDPQASSNTLWYGDQEDVCLTDVVAELESDVADLEANKAPLNHEHDGYADAEHTHSGYAEAGHEHDGYADAEHTHDGYAATAHTHEQASISGLIAALAAKAEATHNHTLAEIVGLVAALAAKADLVDGKVPSSQLPSYVSDVAEYANLAAFPATGESAKIYVAKDTNKTYRWSGTGYVEISASLALGETSATAYRGDRGKTAYDHSQNGDAHVTAAQKTAWNGKAEGDHTHTYSEISGAPTIPTTLPANGGNADTVDNKHASDFAVAGHTHPVYSGASASTYKLVYVGPNGNDNNAGTSASPMATIKGAIRKYAEKHFFLDIRLLDGTYNEDIGAIGTNVANLSIRSVSENKDAVIINMATQLDLNSGLVRLYNMTLNVTATGVRGISANAGALYAYNIRINIPTGSTVSCVNVYNGTHAFLMNCVLNAGTGSGAGAAVYGNQALTIKAINCSSERKVNVGVHAHNGSDIEYTDTINATTKAKQTSWGKCTLRT